jgi:uncharacterized protein YihD (DUF1040 family)
MPKIMLQNQEVFQYKSDREQKEKTDGRSSSSHQFLNLKKRSLAYMKCIEKLDAGNLANNTKSIEEVIQTIKSEFSKDDLVDLPLGILWKCALGHQYDVHLIDLSGKQIIRHYKISEFLDEQFERGRNLARHDAYKMIEIYTNKIVLIRKDGSTVQL